jgi:hypothetical protein
MNLYQILYQNNEIADITPIDHNKVPLIKLFLKDGIYELNIGTTIIDIDFIGMKDKKYIKIMRDIKIRNIL